MSSGRFETRLKPDPVLRRLVAAGAAFSLLAGTAMLAHLPLAPGLRAVAVAAWLAAGVRELACWTRGAARVRALGIDADGFLYALGPGGRRRELELLPGSLVGERLAWLRVRFDDGSRYGELLSGRPEEAAWRRLKVCWRRP